MAEEKKEKIKIGAVQQRLAALSLIPLHKAGKELRRKVIRAVIEYEKISEAYRRDINGALEKLKPEGFDERLRKYGAAINPTDENRREAERQAADEGFAPFKEEYDRVLAEWRELDAEMSRENGYDLSDAVPAFSDEEFEQMGEALSAGEHPNAVEALRFIMQVL